MDGWGEGLGNERKNGEKRRGKQEDEREGRRAVSPSYQSYFAFSGTLINIRPVASSQSFRIRRI